LVELEFYFPINQFSAKSLNQLIQQYTDFPCHELSFSTLTGLMKGFVDLIFQYQNKFYIVDYKSNHLGNHPDDYQQPQLQQAIYEHRYDVQYLIYTVALHRYLQKRLPNYQYQQHFGGVGYLFLRGIDVSLGADYGIYYHCPPYQQIQQLDELFGVHA